MTEDRDERAQPNTLAPSKAVKARLHPVDCVAWLTVVALLLAAAAFAMR